MRNNWWIDLKFKEYYNNSCSKQGIVLHFPKEIDKVFRHNCIDFINFLRKRYFFPIRCNIHFLLQEKFPSQQKGKICYGIFYSNSDYKNEKLPSIHIAAKPTVRETQEPEMFLYLIFFAVAHELTHYFQYYFFEDEKRSNRSLEIEANRYGRYFANLWFESKKTVAKDGDKTQKKL